jgi:hypothetical protein
MKRVKSCVVRVDDMRAANDMSTAAGTSTGSMAGMRHSWP